MMEPIVLRPGPRSEGRGSQMQLGHEGVETTVGRYGQGNAESVGREAKDNQIKCAQHDSNMRPSDS